MLHKLPTTDLTSLDNILRIKKTIPAYQRDFVWEPNLVSTFLENIWDAFENKTENYFCGSMVVFFNDNKQYEIVDGQQRTTVLYSLVSHLIQKIGTIKGDEGFIAVQRAMYVEYDNRKEKRKEFLFTHQNSTSREFLELVGLGEEFNNSRNSNDVVTKNLIKCFNEIINFIDDRLKVYDIEKINDFYEYLLDSVKLIHFISKDISEALLIYSRLNSGGKPLGHLEIIKGQLFSAYATNEYDWKKLDEKWDSFWVKFTTEVKIGGKGTSKNLINEHTFLSYYFLVNHAKLVDKICRTNDGFLPTSKITEFLLHKKVEKEVFNNPLEFVDKLICFTDDLKGMRTGEYDCSKETTEILKDLALLSQVQTQPLMFLLSASYDSKLFEAILPWAMRLVFVFTISVTGTGKTSNVWRNLSREIRNKKDVHKTDELIRIITTEAKKELKKYWDEDFKNFVQTCSIKTHTRKIKVILLMNEIAALNIAQVPSEKNYNKFYGKVGYDIDHISPSSGSEEEFIQKLGNAAILASSDNKSLKNTPFKDKKKIDAMSDSEVITTRAIVRDNDRGAKNKIMGLFTTIKDIDEGTVRSREQEILKCIGKFFEIAN